jgi:4-hydroxy-tetrahydrodipicolinate reductase
MSTIVLGDGPLGRAIGAALEARGDAVEVRGRPAGGRHDPPDLTAADLVVDASRARAVPDNVRAALDAGCRRFVIATTGWDAARASVDDTLRSAGACAVVAANLAPGAAVFLRLVAEAAALAAAMGGFEPAIVEWHRRAKADRPSGTARELIRRIDPFLPIDADEVAVVRAGTMPGHHTVAFDAPGETIELRLTARDRSAYAAGALAAIDWLRTAPRAPGIHAFDEVVDDLVAAATHGRDDPMPARPAA